MHLNLLDLFVKMRFAKYGALLYIKQVLMFWYASPITQAMLNDDHTDIEILPANDRKSEPIFIEAFFIGAYGKTSLFAPKIVIKLKTKEIIYAKIRADSSVAFCTFTNYSFIIKLSKEDIEEMKSYFLNFKTVSLCSLPSSAFRNAHHKRFLLKKLFSIST